MGRPADAWWDATSKEWVHGARDEAGRLVGEVHYWNADDELISTCEHVAGKPHGVARRFYRNGEVAQECRYVDGVIDGERSFLRPRDDAIVLPLHLADASDDVAVCVCVYDKGDMIGMLWRDRRGREVDQQGRAVRKRPANVPATASPLHDGWVYMRRRGEDGGAIIEMREYHANGVLKEQSLYADGSERGYYKNAQLAFEGVRDRTGARHHQIGAWRHYDAKGRLRRVSEYESGEERRRTWHRTKTEAKRGGVTRAGAVERDMEVGTWSVRDDKGALVAEVELGPHMTDRELLEHAVTADELDDAIGDHAEHARDLVSIIARARRAGRERNAARFGLPRAPGWRTLDEDTGKMVALANDARYDYSLGGLVHALRWGPPDGGLLADIAAALFRGDRAQAALDIIDAAILVGEPDPRSQAARAAYLRAVGRGAEADAAISANTRGLDARALELLTMIRDAPDDDGVRLVFADQIAHEFPEHAALIVAQCGTHVPDASELIRAFVATLPPFLRESAGAPVRGFLDGLVYLDAKDFVEADPDVLYRVSPTVSALHLGYASGFVAQLVTMPALRRYRALSFYDTYLFGGGALQLARCPHLEQLEELGLYATSLDDDDLRAILTSQAYPKLESLDIGNSREEQDYSIDAFAAIADAVFAPTLESLAFQRRWFGDAAVPVIAALPNLVALDMGCCSLTDAGAVELAALPLRLTTLDIDHSQVGPEGARALAGSPSLASLETLSIRASPVGNDGAIAIATSPYFKLKHLAINGDSHAVGARFAEALAGGPHVDSLESLEMSLAAIGPAGAAALAGGAFPKLSHLNLHNNQVGDAGAIAIARAPWMKWIRGLDLSGCQITDAGADALAAIDDTRADLWIELGGARLSSAAKKGLAARFGDRVQLEYPWNRR